MILTAADIEEVLVLVERLDLGRSQRLYRVIGVAKLSLRGQTPRGSVVLGCCLILEVMLGRCGTTPPLQILRRCLVLLQLHYCLSFENIKFKFL